MTYKTHIKLVHELHGTCFRYNVKSYESDSISCSDNTLRLLVLVAAILYWGLQVTSSFSIWGRVLKGCFERGIFWRAKSRLKGIEDFNLEHWRVHAWCLLFALPCEKRPRGVVFEMDQSLATNHNQSQMALITRLRFKWSSVASDYWCKTISKMSQGLVLVSNDESTPLGYVRAQTVITILNKKKPFSTFN